MYLLPPTLLLALASPSTLQDPSAVQGDLPEVHRAPLAQGIERVWAGPEFFANRLADWRLADGAVTCVESGARLGLRTLHWLTLATSPRPGAFMCATRVEGAGAGPWIENSLAGLLVGAGGEHVDPRLTAMVHSLPAEDGGMLAVIEADGRVALRDHSQDSGKGGNWSVSAEVPLELLPLLEAQERRGDGFGGAAPEAVDLLLSAGPDAAGYTVRLTAHRVRDGALISSATATGVHPGLLDGGLALVSHRGVKGAGGFSFRNWSAQGDKLRHHPERAFGPVLSTLYTLQGDELRLTAQLGVLGSSDPHSARLEVREGDAWVTVAEADYVQDSCTVPFRIKGWDASQEEDYRVVYELARGAQERELTYYAGRIRREPVGRDLVVAGFTGHKCYTGGLRWNSNGFWFPHRDIIDAVTQHDPDLLFFSGDQIYEGDFDPAVRKRDNAVHDYLYKWSRWCWAFRDLTRDRPAICIPDDHDVYHGNIWGAAGISGKPQSEVFNQADRGGYMMPARFVNAVHRTQTSHLPEPYDGHPLANGVLPYHTTLSYGGLSCAILADRMWKSAPAVLLSEGNCRNGWFQDPEFDPVTQSDVEGAVLLGPSQEAMLEEWAGDWSGGVWSKLVLSQTLFANVATLPREATSDGVTTGLPIQPAGVYAAGEKRVADADSNGWPQTPRDRALRSMRKGFAVHLAGDQHLGSTVRYGVDAWDDAGYALCVPSVGNTFPRRWFPPERGGNQAPGAPRYTGQYRDGFGNLITVHAVSNPHRTGIEPAGLHDRAPGYGIVRLERATRRVTLECWPRWARPGQADAAQYPGWPVQFDLLDGYGRRPAAWLPEVRVEGLEEPVFKLLDGASGELIYALRAPAARFRPWAFSLQPVDLWVGEPGTRRWMRVGPLTPAQEPPREPLLVTFGS